ncbi:MAG: hypothetical protein WCO56_06480 [Verrucomicrobiota bacterium]
MKTMIRKSMPVVFASVLAIAHPIQAATITGNVRDTGLAAVATNLTFTPLSTPLVTGGSVLLSSVSAINSDETGQFSLTLGPGNYRVTVGGNARDSLLIAVPEGIGTRDWTTLVTGSLTYQYPWSPAYLDRALFTTRGDLLVCDGAKVVRLGAGTANQLLMANPAAAAGLSWTDAAFLTNGLATTQAVQQATNSVAQTNWVRQLLATNLAQHSFLPMDGWITGGTVSLSQFATYPTLAFSSNANGKTVEWNIPDRALIGTNASFTVWYLTTNATRINTRFGYVYLAPNGVGTTYLLSDSGGTNTPPGTNVTVVTWNTVLPATNGVFSFRLTDTYHYNTNEWYFVLKTVLRTW